MKDYDKNKESSCLKYWDVNNLYGWAMLQDLPISNVDWIEGTYQFYEDFIKTVMKKLIKDIFLKLMFKILKSYMNFIMFTIFT